jgi:hypothetical protein
MQSPWQYAEKCNSEHTGCDARIAYCQNCLVNRTTAIIIKMILCVGMIEIKVLVVCTIKFSRDFLCSILLQHHNIMVAEGTSEGRK